VKTLAPQELANLWYLKFGNKWVSREDLDEDWRSISKELMRNNLADYDLINDPKIFIITEIIKLKETCR